MPAFAFIGNWFDPLMIHDRTLDHLPVPADATVRLASGASPPGDLTTPQHRMAIATARPGQARPEARRPRPVRLECMAISRQWVIDLLNHMGYSEAAEEASRVLPDPLDLKQLEEFGDQHGISRSELVSRMGGSP
jgi:hypothetical protein